jgi:hypothetical protein
LLTFGNGFEYTLDLEYRAGNPTYKYGNVDVLWKGGYSFGNLSNLQPAELHKVTYAPNAVGFPPETDLNRPTAGVITIPVMLPNSTKILTIYVLMVPMLSLSTTGGTATRIRRAVSRKMVPGISTGPAGAPVPSLSGSIST